jgi:hypothetical protein
MAEDLDEMFRPPVSLRPRIRVISQNLFDILKDKAKDIGWCLVAHGSMERDLDILAIPWTVDAEDSLKLIELIRVSFGDFVSGKSYRSAVPSDKPFGRKAYSFYAYSDSDENLVECHAGAFPFIDLSIVDLRETLERSDLS